MKYFRKQNIIKRYKKNYSISANADILEEMILAHWKLEKRLTKELLRSSPENRWETFERCYSMLYHDLWWLNSLCNTNKQMLSSELYKDWVHLIGPLTNKIYEIGSGEGKMIRYLASRGFKCKGTEITQERGEKFVSKHHNLSWGISDGVHFEKFESPDLYDVSISRSVIEHLHPEDLYDHFKGVYFILKSGGRYMFETPHKCSGPSDISRVFMAEEPMGMHLKEYTYQELKQLLVRVGFKNISAVYKIPLKISQLLDLWIKPIASSLFLYYSCILEKTILLLPNQLIRRIATKIFRIIFFCPNIFMIAEK